MSKTKTLFTMALLVLLGSMGAAQAQGFADVKMFTTPTKVAREGGQNEVAGSILLNTSSQEVFAAADGVAGATIMLKFSAPLAADITVDSVTSTGDGVTVTGATGMLVGTAENDDDNDGNGTVELSALDLTSDNVLIRGVRLDVSGAEGPITVTLEITPRVTDFIRTDGSPTASVIDDIQVGVEAEPKTDTVRTRGTGAGGMTTTLTLKESFKTAFRADTNADGEPVQRMLEVEFSGIPEGATLTATVMTPVEDPRGADEGDRNGANGANAATVPFAMISAVKGGSATVTLGGPDGLEPPQMMRAHPTEVVLAVTLIANPNEKDTKASFPLDRGSVMAKATFTDPSGIDNFVDAFTDYVAVFNIRPAQCELLFPVVSVLPSGNWDTALSVTNPGYRIPGSAAASGGLTFTFYGQDNPAVVYETTSVNTGSGLEADGTLAPGGTYQVLVSELLAAVEWGAMFRGHVHLTADYTNCSGLGWVTDFMGVNQAYTATVIDLDTGKDDK